MHLSPLTLANASFYLIQRKSSKASSKLTPIALHQPTTLLENALFYYSLSLLLLIKIFCAIYCAYFIMRFILHFFVLSCISLNALYNTSFHTYTSLYIYDKFVNRILYFLHRCASISLAHQIYSHKANSRLTANPYSLAFCNY